MNKILCHDTRSFDEFGLVYEKAEKDKHLAGLLDELQEQALEECRAAAPLLKMDGRPLTAEVFDTCDGAVQEEIIGALAASGLAGLDLDYGAKTVRVTLSPNIVRTRACTFLNLLNRLEKLDGSLNARFGDCTLELLVPLGARKGLVGPEMLISGLYPWLHVTEKSASPMAAQPAPQKVPEKAPEKAPGPPKPEKKGLFGRLFGKH